MSTDQTPGHRGAPQIINDILKREEKARTFTTGDEYLGLPFQITIADAMALVEHIRILEQTVATWRDNWNTAETKYQSTKAMLNGVRDELADAREYINRSQ